jgi:GT2 family glycosyltransferase
LDSDIFLLDNSAYKFEKERLIKSLQNDKHIHLYFSAENIGFAAGVNFAIQKAISKGFKQFLLLNNDAVLLTQSGPVLKEFFNHNPAALLAPVIRWRENVHRGCHYHKYLGLIENNRSSQNNAWLYYLTGCALAFDVEFLKKVGMFDENFFMYGEDIELSHRAASKGVPIRLIDQELVFHEGSRSSQIASFFYEFHIARMHFLLSFLLFQSHFHKCLALSCKFGILSIRALIRSVQYKTWSPLSALILAPLPLKIRPISFRNKNS